MKTLNRLFWLLVAPLALAACGDSDEPEPEPAPTPVVSISKVTPAAESVSFFLSLSNADAYEYGCFLTSDYEAGGTGELTRVESATADDAIVITGLEPETSYTLVAVACAGETRSAERTQAFETTAAVESELPVIRVENIEITYESVSFEVSRVSGLVQAYRYAAYLPGAEPQFSEQAAEGDGPMKITIDKLRTLTEYTLEVYAINDGLNDNESEHFTENFTTPVKPEEPAPFTLAYEAYSLSPETSARITIDFGEVDRESVDEIRYVNLSDFAFRQAPLFSRADSIRVRLSADPMTYTDGQTVKVSALQLGTRFPLQQNLDANTNYNFFAVLKYTDGTFSPMGKVEFTTPKYDVTGTAKVASWERASSEQAVVNGVPTGTEYATLSITPGSDCAEMWAWCDNTSASITNDYQKLINSAKSQTDAAQWYHSGSSAWTTPEIVLTNNVEYRLIFVVKGKDGKYNVERVEGVKSQYSNGSEPAPGPDEGEGEGEGGEVPPVDPKN